MAEPALSLPSRPFAGRTGRGVRVAVIDSGVQVDHPHIDAAHIGPGIAILPDGSIVDGAEAAVDRLGHGTAVTAALQEKAPGAQCLPIRIFHDALRTRSSILLTAIRWAVEQGADIVNLSLGTSNAAQEAAFARVAGEAVEGGALLVAARDAGGVPCYPGALAQVAGVTLDWDMPREAYGVEKGAILTASGYPRAIPGVPVRRNLYGISFAVAQISGFAALACEGMTGARDGRRVEALRRSLMEEAGGLK